MKHLNFTQLHLGKDLMILASPVTAMERKKIKLTIE
jgi:hypothetical protein